MELLEGQPLAAADESRSHAGRTGRADRARILMALAARTRPVSSIAI
jgi:hypothetical protein